MSSTVALLKSLSLILSTTVVTMRVLQDVINQLQQMQEEGRDPTAKEWQELEAKADHVDQRLANAIREARRESAK